MLRCSGDDSFGPVLGPGSACYNFDFTLFFEELIFSLIPSALVVIAAISRGVAVWGRPLSVKWPAGKALKHSGFVALATFQIALIGLWARGYGVVTRVTIPAGILALLGTLTLMGLSELEHGRVLRPSLVIQTYLLFTAFLDIARVRTQWLLDQADIVPSLVTVTLALKLGLLVLESVNKARFLKEEKPALPPLERTGIFGRALLIWLNPMFLLGYSKDLTVDDLFPLDSDLNGGYLTKSLTEEWKKANKSRKHSLTNTILVTCLPDIVLSWLPRSLNLAFTLAKPYLVQTTLGYITYHDQLPVNYGYGLIGAYAIVFIGSAISNQMFNFQSSRIMVKLRGSLVGILYQHMLEVRAESKNSASAMSLMSVDVDSITLSARWAVDIVPNLAQVVLASWILSGQIGAVCVAPLVVALFSAVALAWVAQLLPPRQQKWMAAIQKRTGITADVLGSMRGVKMMGLVDPITTQIQGLRDFELGESKKFRQVQIGTIALSLIPMLSMGAVTFTVFAIVAKISGTGSLGITKAFTSLSLLSILVMPVALLITSFSSLFQAVASLDRIQDFLLLEKRADFRSSGRRLTSGEKDKPVWDDESSGRSVMEVKGASFGWEKQGAAVLRDVNLSVHQSSLTLLVGPVASGKSSLLGGLLGETYLHSGSVWIEDVENVAYCDQDPWILNQSIRDNIIGFSEYEEGFYGTVIRACQLEEDFSQLPEGDMSLVGSQGISLSGGQKQRVALARAVYSRKKIVILDDTMKGLDADTATKCFNALLGRGGLLRRDGTAVVMATHNAQWFQEADTLVVLRDGQIANIGSFTSLKDSDEFIAAHSIAPTGDSKNTAMDIDEGLEKESIETTSGVSVAVVESHPEKKAQDHSDAPAAGKKKGGRGKMNSSLAYYLKSLFSFTFALCLAFLLLQTACGVIQPLWLNYWASANERNPNEDPGVWVGIYVLFSLLHMGFMILEFMVYLLSVIPSSAKSLHWQILKVTMNAPMSFFVETDVGSLVNRFSQDMTLVDFALPISLIQTTEQLLLVIGDLALTSISSGYLAISIPAILLILFYIQRFYLRTSRQLRLLDLEAKSPLYSYFISSFAGLTAIRAFSWPGRCYAEHLRRLDTSQRPAYLLYSAQMWLAMVLELTVAGLCVLLVGLSVALRDRIAVGLLGVALTSTMSFSVNLTGLIHIWVELETSLSAITRIRAFVAETPQEPPAGREQQPPPPPAWPSRGAITVAGLTAAYGDHTVLDGVDLAVGAGERVALCGRSGSGKSTLLAALLRLYEPVAGTTTIDGVDTAGVAPRALRAALVALPQDPLLLAGTVRYNLDPTTAAVSGGGGGARDAEMLAALDKAGLRAVIEDRGGLDAELSAEWLSAGQKQLFCLARAMLRKSRVLLLDEATSSLDHQTDELIQSLIRKEFPGWTMVVVAHRLKTIADFDKVVVLKDGKVAECDNPDTLLKRGGLFKRMWDLQNS